MDLLPSDENVLQKLAPTLVAQEQESAGVPRRASAAQRT
jgi:hypothetical protein